MGFEPRPPAWEAGIRTTTPPTLVFNWANLRRVNVFREPDIIAQGIQSVTRKVHESEKY